MNHQYSQATITLPNDLIFSIDFTV